MKKILVIEDMPSIREETLTLLELEAFEVMGAENGVVGVQLAQKQLPDLIICDIMMPELDGYGVLETLRKNPATATIPFIFLTAKAEKADLRQGMALGADDYITKPFTADELLAAVNARLEKHAEVVRNAEQKLDHLRSNIALSLPHEFRTPLSSILGYSALFIEGLNKLQPNDIIVMAKDIHDSALRLHRLIENYLLYAQIELIVNDSQKIQALTNNRLDSPGKMIKEIAVSKAGAVHRQADLILEVDEAAVRISCEHLKKIIEELVDNAFKFSKAGAGVRVTANAGNEVFTLCVEDHGRGMTAEQIAEVGAYVQFDRQIYEQQGSGLGLTLAIRLAELYGGRLTIESVPNKQTTVCVRFPRLD
jgi:signal transduction histidine kinase